MRFSFAALALFAVAASAQTIPTCATTCISQANLGGCAATDNHCLCTNQQFVTSVTQCIQGACTGSDLQNAEAAAQALCLAVGVSLSAPTSTPTAPASSGAGSSTRGSATSSATSAGASTSTTGSPNSASSHSIGAAAGLAAFGLAALAL